MAFNFELDFRRKTSINCSARKLLQGLVFFNSMANGQKFSPTMKIMESNAWVCAKFCNAP